jgi:hypothetical protein
VRQNRKKPRNTSWAKIEQKAVSREKRRALKATMKIGIGNTSIP